MTSRFLSYFKGIRAGALLIAAIAAVVSKKVVKTELVPEQLYWLSDAGILAAMAALAAIPSIGARPGRQLTKALLIVMALTFCTVIAIRAELIEEIEINKENHRYLVGYTMTEAGRDMETNCMTAGLTQNLPHLPRYDLIKCTGATAIPAMYGVSYIATSVVYLVSYLCFLGVFVLLVGGIFEPGPQTP